MALLLPSPSSSSFLKLPNVGEARYFLTGMRVAELQIGHQLYELRGFFIIGIASSIFCSGSLHSVVAVFPKRSCFIYHLKDLQWCAEVVIW